MSLGVFHLLEFFEIVWRMGVSTPLTALWNSPVKPSGPGLLCVGSFLITVSISSDVIGLFRLSASSSLSFRRLHFSRNLSISSRFSHILAYSSS